MNILAADRGFHPPHLDARAKPLVMMPRSPSKLITSEVFQDVVLWGSVGNLSRRIGLIAQSVFAAILSADVFSLMPLGPAKFTSATFRNSSYSRSAYSGGACGLLCHSLLALHPFVISGSSIWIWSDAISHRVVPRSLTHPFFDPPVPCTSIFVAKRQFLLRLGRAGVIELHSCVH